MLGAAGDNCDSSGSAGVTEEVDLRGGMVSSRSLLLCSLSLFCLVVDGWD